MAILARGVTIGLSLQNRPDIPNPITGIPTTGLKFVDFNPTTQFCFSIWAKVVPGVGGITDLITIQGVDGSFVKISHNSTNWLLSFRTISVTFSTVVIAPVIVGRWQLFVFIKDMINTKIFLGTEDSPADPDNLVTIGQAVHVTNTLDFKFGQISIPLSNTMAICNFKYWKTIPSQFELQAQGNKWMNTTSAEVVEPLLIWASPLRAPGDISNIVNPLAPGPVDSWFRHFGFNHTVDSSDLNYTADPAYMAKHTVCAAWLYPSFKDIDVNTPVTSTATITAPPPVATFVGGTPLWRFEDRGVFPTGTPFQTITYYGYPIGPTGIDDTGDIWGYFIDENGIDVTQGVPSDPNNRFLQTDTGIPVPNTVNVINVYLWQFGMQARFQPIPTTNSSQTLADMHLYITYVGSPTGIPVVPEIDLTGLFVIKKGTSVDQYNRGIRLKIPDPTIRSAYIGE